MSRHGVLSCRPVPSSAASLWAERATYAAIFALGMLLFWLSRSHPSLMPFWAPWDFSSSVYLATALILTWYWRGLVLSRTESRPPLWRRVFFFLGVLLIYAVLQTRFEYWSQHMFFLNRTQNVAMHDLGPFFIALGWPVATIKAGMPEFLRRMIEGRIVAALMRPFHQPVVAIFLFVGFFYFWLIPVVHFRAMIDHDLYMVMNWTMISGRASVLVPRHRSKAETARTPLLLDADGAFDRRHVPHRAHRRAPRFHALRSLSLLRSLRPALPVDRAARRSTDRRHHQLDPTRHDERCRRFAGLE